MKNAQNAILQTIVEKVASQKGIKKAPSKYSGPDGGDEWIRTTDSRIFSPMLYQLSYITVEWESKSSKPVRIAQHLTQKKDLAFIKTSY